MMIHYSSLLSLLLLWTSEAQKSGCDLKDAECLDEKQVFFQLRSEVSDSKDSERSVAAQRRWRWRRWRRRNRRYHPYHPYGPNTTTTTTTTTIASSTATLEAREVTLNTQSWVSVDFTQPFAEVPVVVVTPTESGNTDPASVRVKDITTSGFSARISKPPRTSLGDHTMTVTFLAAAPGVRQLAGLWVEVGTISTQKCIYSSKKCPGSGLPVKKWQQIAFAHEFPAPPAFLTSVQTLNNAETWLTVGVNSVKTNEAWVSLERAETTSYGQVNQDEVVGYIAIQGGSATLQSTTGAVTMATAVSNRIVRGWKQGSFDVPLGTDLSVGSPLAVASQCTHYGGDGGWARLRGVSSSSVKVAIDEDMTCDTERSHTKEIVSVCAFSGPCVL